MDRLETKCLGHGGRIDDAPVFEQVPEVARYVYAEPRQAAEGGVEEAAGERLGNAPSEAEDSREVQLAPSCDVEGSGNRMIRRVLKSSDSVALMHELESRIEAHECWYRRQRQVSADRVPNVWPEDRREAQNGKRHVGMSLGGLRYESFHLREISLELAWRSLWSSRFLENRRVAGARSVEGRVGFYDNPTHRIESFDRAEQRERAEDPFLRLRVPPPL